MNWLLRLERAIEDSLEGQPGDHPLELARQAWGLLSRHPRPAGLCPNRLYLPAPLSAELLAELERHVRERGWELAGPLHVLPGPLEAAYAESETAPRARAVARVKAGMSEGKRALFRDSLLIGRAEEAGLRLGDPQVSRRHCTVRLEGRDILLDEQPLKAGQTFAVGANQVQVYLLGG